jgi:hypothetical protein
MKLLSCLSVKRKCLQMLREFGFKRNNGRNKSYWFVCTHSHKTLGLWIALLADSMIWWYPIESLQ